jgi:hypothetical protein
MEVADAVKGVTKETLTAVMEDFSLFPENFI